MIKLTESEYLDNLQEHVDKGPYWHAGTILVAMCTNRHRILLDPDGHVYLARFWLSRPLPSGTDPDRWSAANSVLIHHILQPDQDRHMHDHPWPFSTTVLSGGYTEQSLDEGRRVEHTLTAGAKADRSAFHLHRIVSVKPDTWTLVSTGPAIRRWGFLEDGGQWTDARDYLRQPA